MPESNFRLLDLRSLMGELNANQLGIDLFPSASTNVGYFLNSTDRLNAFLTQQPNGRILRNPQPDIIEVLPPGYDPSASMPYPRGQRPPTQQGGDVVVGDGVMDMLRKANPFLWLFDNSDGSGVLSRNTQYAVFLFFIALLLIAAGVFSLK